MSAPPSSLASTLPRVLVVGGGLAGAAAALAARSHGAAVQLVAQAPGATAFASGLAWPALSERRGPLSAAAPAPSGSPRSPLAAAALRPSGRLLPALVTLPSPGRFANVLGEVVSAGLVQPAQALGQLHGGERVAVVGLRGAPQLLDAGWVAEGLRAVGFEVVAREARLELTVAEVRRSPFAWAAALDSPAEVERLGRALLLCAQQMDLCLLPPILGLTFPAVERLAAIAGCRVGELAATVPSVPGLRLQRALESEVLAQGGDWERGTVVQLAPGRAELADGQVLSFDAAVLATGRYLGGGVQRQEALREPLLDLPLFAGPLGDGQSGEGSLVRAPIGELVGTTVGAAAAAFAVGLRVDEQWRPIGSDGEAVGWLRAAGSVLAGPDGGLAAALDTGVAAGRSAAQEAWRRRGGSDRRAESTDVWDSKERVA